jgi:hypothetical protein
VSSRPSLFLQGEHANRPEIGTPALAELDAESPRAALDLGAKIGWASHTEPHTKRAQGAGSPKPCFPVRLLRDRSASTFKASSGLEKALGAVCGLPRNPPPRFGDPPPSLFFSSAPGAAHSAFPSILTTLRVFSVCRMCRGAYLAAGRSQEGGTSSMAGRRRASGGAGRIKVGDTAALPP